MTHTLLSCMVYSTPYVGWTLHVGMCRFRNSGPTQILKQLTKPIFFFFFYHCIMFCCYLFNRETKKLLLKINYFHHVNMTLSVKVDKFSQSPEATFITFSQEILFSFWKTIQNPCSEGLNMNVFQTGFLLLLQRILVWFAIQLTSPTFTASRFLFN